MEITEDYVSFEVAKLLKEKGFYQDFFNEITPVWKLNGNKEELAFYGDDNYPCEWEEWYSAPTLHMACKWLRKEHNLYVSPTYRCFCGSKKNDKPYYKWEDRVLILPSGNQVHPQIYGIHEYYETYEGAIEAACLYVLKNLI